MVELFLVVAVVILSVIVFKLQQDIEELRDDLGIEMETRQKQMARMRYKELEKSLLAEKLQPMQPMPYDMD